ncbi:hypothetical protein BS78_01G441200 [Paspalum vaginatum]|nr:hypothetical protein BS78_01G441200 [Paspalum vaginatum]
MGTVVGELDSFDAGRCAGGYALGLAVGRRFADVIRSRTRQDVVLRDQLMPFASTAQSQPLLAALQSANRERYPRHWDELVGTADGSGVPLLHLILLNFRKEILPFVPKEEGDDSRGRDRREGEEGEPDGDCSDVLVVSDSAAIAAHNEDGNVALLGHTYLVRATLPDGLSFTAYTYAGELPSCAFGFNSNGVAFTLNSVPPVNDEIVAGAISRNFVSRDLLEAKNLEDAMHCPSPWTRGSAHRASQPDTATTSWTSEAGGSSTSRPPPGTGSPSTRPARRPSSTPTCTGISM